jgi:alpha-glucosidase
LISQPDLNFHNVDVQDALLDVVRFWLDRGVDGFRLDTINFYYADKDLRDNPPLPKDKRNATIAPSVNPYNHQDHVYSKNQPENLEFLERFRAVLDQYPGTTCVGEVGDAQRGLEILGEYTDGDHRVHMCYAFELLSGARPTAQFIAETFGRLDAAAPDGWACWAYSNHDVKRHATRWDLSHEAQKLFHTLMVCLRGSLCLYQGEELGLPEADVPFDLLQDPYGIEFWPEYKGRDGCRTPMVWERSNHHAGFSTAQTSWLPVPANHLEHAVEVQEANENALIHHYRRALKLRHRFDALRIGDQGGMVANGDVLTFTRRHNGQEVFCAFNLGDTEVTLSAPAGSWAGIGADIGAAEIGPNGTITLQGWQACIAEKQT